MSLIKANAVQIGQSGTATQNFTLAVPSSPDGTIKLARGNAGATTQDVLSVDASGNVSFAGGIPSGNISSSTAIATGSTTARSLANRFADVVNVLDFGADPTGVSDSSSAFNLAVVAAKAVHVPPGTYLIKNQIVIPNGVMMFGLSGFVPSAFATVGGGSILKYHSDLGSTPMVWCQNTSWLSFIAFKGPGKGTGIAILNKKTNPGTLTYEDMDCTIHGCTFDGWDVCVEHWNRGLWFDGNISALTDISVSLNIDTANWIDDPANPFDLPQQGFRAIRITNNRFHANTAAITNVGTGREYLRGLNVVNNQVDVGDNLFSGFCYASCFSGNTLDQVGTAALDFYGDVKDISICGNTINGDTPSGQNYPLYLIRFRATSENITIQGNTFANTNNHGILTEGAISKSVISGNTFKNIGNDGSATNACIRILQTASDVSITGNSFFPIVAPYGVRGITTQNWTNVIVDNNSWNTSDCIACQYGETGTNYIQGRQVETPIQLTGSVSDYNPSDASIWRLSSNSDVDVNGLLFAYKLVGRILTIINVGSFNITIKHLALNPTATSQIITSTGADIVLAPNQSIQLLKDYTSTKWRTI